MIRLRLASPADRAQSILTVLAVPAAFLLGAYLHYVLLLNLVLSFLWLAVVVFAAWWFSGAGSAQAHAVEAFSFLALYVNV